MIELISSTELVAITAILGSLLPIEPVVARFSKPAHVTPAHTNEGEQEIPANIKCCVGMDALAFIPGYQKQCLRKQSLRK